MASADVILDVQDLHVRFPVFGGVIPRKKAEVRAVDGVSLTLASRRNARPRRGIGLRQDDRRPGDRQHPAGDELPRRGHGQVLYHRDGEIVDLAALSRSEMRPYRSDLQMVFQDPYSSLNPRMTVGRDHRGAAEDPHQAVESGAARPRALAAGEGWAVAGACQPLSPRILGRAAPAHRHRARAGDEPARS